MTENSFVYFDHNILNLMINGQESKIRQLYEAENLQPLYSDENVDEIDRSTKRRNSFYDLLDRIGAMHVSFPMDDSFNHTGTFSVDVKSARFRSDELKRARAGYGSELMVLNFLTKMYGGVEDRSFTDIMTTTFKEVEMSIRNQLREHDFSKLGLECMKVKLETQLAEIKKIQEEIPAELRELDELVKVGAAMEQLATATGYTNIQLNNISPPDVIAQVWKLVGDKYGGPELSLVDYLQNFASAERGPDTQPPIIKLVNGAYNWLNMVGYYRDDGLKKVQRLRASFGDMTHAGYGVVCAKFFCNDLKMRKKIQAVYDYLGIKCEICEIY
jgi:hypothetical protein